MHIHDIGVEVFITMCKSSNHKMKNYWLRLTTSASVLSIYYALSTIPSILSLEPPI